MLDKIEAIVVEVAVHFGFRSPTTFALEYRKRFGMSPSRTKRAAYTREGPDGPQTTRAPAIKRQL